MADVYETIANAADKYGVPVEALLAIAKIESNFQAGADNPNSSASGLFQFTDGTAGGLGLTGDKRNDLVAQAEAAAKMAAANSRSLASALGRPPTAGELYLAHQQGLSGAKALLANPDLPASEVLARFHGNNASKVITQNGGNLNMTAGEFASQWVNKGNQTAGLFPPGEIPRVGTALATVPTPRPPVPVTPSIDLAQYRKNVAPSQLGPETFAQLSKPKRYLGDELGMSPIPGGKQQAPMFDAGFDTRTGEMRLFANGPADTQGVFTGASKAPAPIPRMPSPQLMGKRATAPVLQAALNAKYPAQPPQVPSPAIGGPPTTKMVQSIPVPKPSFSYAGQDASGQHPKAAHITSYAYAPPNGGNFPTTAQIKAATPFGGGGVGDVPERLPSQAMLPGLPPPVLAGGNMAVHQVASPFGQVAYQQITPTQFAANKTAPTPFQRPPSFGATQMAQGKVAPIPFNRPTGVGTQLSTQPMPPMPIPRPPMGMGGAERPAPIPASMSPFLALQRSLPMLRPPTSPAAQKVWMTGFSGPGTSGGAHGGSADEKVRGENKPINGRSY